ncbi:uncharacterized protein CDAR_531291 [Caerostris darwini]|uniref:Uncharacterized protein n=1 Tax=Caerostris darwini TaxID=1538125 RepID=A0AAV4R119_9ARAC|nr:uncharacterized protein CDAR_531291 [Caerostris darwini]
MSGLHDLSAKRYFSLLQNPIMKAPLCAQLSSFPLKTKWYLFRYCLSWFSESKITDANLSFTFTDSMLTNLTLCNINFGNNFHLILEVLLSINPDLRSLELIDIRGLYENQEEASDNLNKLLLNSLNLEELHCCIPFDLKSLMLCKVLKHLKLCFLPKRPWTDFLDINNGNLQHSNHLISFTLCSYSVKCFPLCRNNYVGNSMWRVCYPNHIEELLNICNYCVELRAVGSLEKQILSTYFNVEMEDSLNTPTNFMSRTCFYACNNGFSEIPFDIREEIPLVSAVWLFSEVEKLSVQLCEEVFLYPLMNLQKLEYFNLVFSFPPDTRRHLNPVLESLGHQLKYLRLHFDVHGISLTVLQRNCPNLKWLVLQCWLYVEDGNCSENFVHLEDLNISPPSNFHRYDESVEILLSRSRNLKALSLDSGASQPVDDECLDRILKNNNFSKLKTTNIGECNLSRRGFQKFLAHAQSLESLFISFRRHASTFELSHVVHEINPNVRVNDGLYTSRALDITNSFP